MTTEIMQTNTRTLDIWTPSNGTHPIEAGKVVTSFLDTATTSMGRATHYNSRTEQQAAELASHAALMGLSRDLYAVLLALPGTTDRAIQVGMKSLLSTPRNGKVEFLDSAQERAVLYHLIQALPAQRMLKLIDAFRVGSEELGLKKANNARTRKLILRSLLGSNRLQLWVVKYRSKVQRALTHAWGKKKTSFLRSVLSKDGRRRNAKERGILKTEIARYSGDKAFKTACECVGFALGVRERLTLPLLKAFEAAKSDLSAGAKLPIEVLEGIRSTFHKDVPKDTILRVAKNLTTGQKMQVQKRAKAAGVEVRMDPTKYDAVRLYLYAFECGLDDAITAALDIKARKAAESFPARYGKVGILVDASASMAGDKTQPLRPMAATLALRDMLQHVGQTTETKYVGGQMGELVRPMGDTALADGLVEVLTSEPEAVFVLSDGYENSPSGRFAEVMSAVREIGVETPVYHLNPVFAAESSGVRELAPNNGVPTLPAKSPEALGTSILRGLIETDPVRGINALMRMALTAGPTETRTLLASGN